MREPDVPSGCGCPRYCTQETGTSAGWGLVFVVIVGFSGERGVWWSGSHVRSGGSAHMGTGLRPLLTVLFRMIPRLPPTQSTRKCATPTIPGTRKHRQADTPVRSRCLHRLRRTRASGSSTSPPSPPRTTTTQTLTPVSDVMTHHKLDAEPDRSQAGVQPISTRVATDLKAELDRSRHGIRPISVRSARSAWTIGSKLSTTPARRSTRL